MDSLRKLLAGSVLGACVLMPLGVSAAVAEVPPNPIAGDLFDDGNFIMDAFDAAAYGAEIRFPYMNDKVYKIYAQPGFVTDIVLEKNEKITYVGGGDTARWKVDTSAVGSPYESYCHLYVKPLSSGITTDLIINTDKRVYRLMVYSGLRYNAVVRWLYDDSTSGSQKDMGMIVSGDGTEISGGVNPAEIDFNFKIDKPELGWAPASVFRSGLKTYIKMKPEIIHYDLPSFFEIDDEGKPNIVGYRYVNGTFVIDKFFKTGVLLAGKKGKIKITYKGNDIHVDAKNDERGKNGASGNAQNGAAAVKAAQSTPTRNSSGSSNVTLPPMPRTPPMPGSSTSASAPIVRREVSQQEQAEIRAKEQAITSAISFGISNGGVK